jgi:hypothetical protein
MKRSIATLVALTGLGLAATLTQAADDSFVGKWKFNPEKSQLSGLDYKIEDAGGGKYKFVFGDDVETLTLDGKPHKTKYGNMWSIKQTGPKTWDSTMKRNGKEISTSKWNLSDDGQTLTTTDQNMRPDGSKGTAEMTFKREGSGSGLAGDWKSESFKDMSPTTIEITKGKTGGYVRLNPAYKSRLAFTFDGKESSPTGPQVAKGTTVTAKKTGDNSMELTYKLNGKTTETDHYELSADGKTLTDTINYPGVDKAEVDVFDRE